MRSVKFYDAGNWKPTISPFEKVSDAKKLVEAKGHDFELLWQNNDMQKLTQILPDVPWKELRNGYNAACEKARISVDQDFMQEYNEIMRLANDEKMMNKAEELRQRNAYTTVPPMRLGQQADVAGPAVRKRRGHQLDHHPAGFALGVRREVHHQ